VAVSTEVKELVEEEGEGAEIEEEEEEGGNEKTSVGTSPVSPLETPSSRF